MRGESFTLYRRAAAFIEKNAMISPGDTVVAGVSGGADSMAMLHVLREYRKKREFSLYVLHVHHGIRGAEADRDCRLVQETCRSWGISCKVRFYDVPAAAREKQLGLEETGRLLRKEAFQSVFEELQVPAGKQKKAVAHQQEDVAETVLHNLARGTGIYGIASMRPVSGSTIRPVLCLSRKEIEAYLEANKISCITDSTNLTGEYTRNRIRHDILPLLCQEINSRAVQHIASCAAMTAEAVDYIAGKGRKLLETCPSKEGEILFTDLFFQAERAEQTSAVLQAVELLCGGRRDFSSRHVEELLSLYGLQTGRRLSLPGELAGYRVYEGVRLCREGQAENGFLEKELMVPGTVAIGQAEVQTRIFPWEGQKIVEKKYTKWLDYDRIEGSLVIRNRKEGDYMLIGVPPHRKKLSRIMIDDHIPAAVRSQALLVAEGNRILVTDWGRMSDYYKITDETEKIMEICFKGLLQEGK